MLIPAVVAFFKYKIVSSIIVLACLPPAERIRILREFSHYGISATITCDPAVLGHVQHALQGVLYLKQHEDKLLKKVKREHFALQYKWLIVGDELPDNLKNVRYDADLTFINKENFSLRSDMNSVESSNYTIYFQDVYVHAYGGLTVHPWAHWIKSNFVLTHDREKTLRRHDLKGFPLRIATPIGIYSEDTYHGTFTQYLADEKLLQMDSGIRSGHGGSSLIIDRLNATNILVPTMLWSTELHNDSMLVKLESGDAELAGGVLRILLNRINRVDYILPIWPFRVGFTYLAERESSSNMFVEPFAEAVWWTCLGIGVILVVAQRLTSRSRMEKDGACFTVLATCLQQDASAVPEGISGRWTFTVLSISSMLVHAYYTSAIVSALMSTGRTGPDSLRSLADSRYAIASEDYDYMRYLMFDVKTNWDDLEYLKKMKMTPKFYQTIERGVDLIQQGDTAFHTEFNQIFPYFKTLTSDQLCKLQYLDTIPESMTYITTTINGQWTNTFKSTSDWIMEVGLAKRLVSRLRAPRPECRAALLAERVKFGDVAPVMMLAVSSAVLSLIILGIEIFFSRWKKGRVTEDIEKAPIEADGDSNITNVETLSQYSQY